MQVACATCQLSFDAPEGATGLVCPICRGPLLPKSAQPSADGGGDTPKTATEWSAGDLDDVIAILSAPAVSARVEVLGPTGDATIGEVHLLAGGVSDSIFDGKATDDALDRLRALKPTRFRIEQRLPNPNDGNLSTPGPETGTLDGRALAHLMRYCEDYVISCAIEVWRGNETARVEYRRGEISGVTVGGIDAPERLAEVMQWSSGNYRLVIPQFTMPAAAPKRAKPEAATPAPVPAPAPSAQAARHASATKTIFGMPVAEIAKARAAAEAAKVAEAAKLAEAAKAPGPTPAATTHPPATATHPAATATHPATAAATHPPAAAAAHPPAGTTHPPTPARAPTPTSTPRLTPPGVAPSATPPPVSYQASATKTIFGVPAPKAPEGFASGTSAPATHSPSAARPAEPAAPTASAREADSSRNETTKVDRKTGARKVDVPTPAMAPPPAMTGATAPSKPAPAAPPVVAAPLAEPSEPATQPGFDTRAVRKRPEPTVTDKLPKVRPDMPIWKYIGLGLLFGGVLLGILQVYGLLSH